MPRSSIQTNLEVAPNHTTPLFVRHQKSLTIESGSLRIFSSALPCEFHLRAGESFVFKKGDVVWLTNEGPESASVTIVEKENRFRLAFEHLIFRLSVTATRRPVAPR
jgi:hypothetical protein